jgi:hypothetical protein
MRASAQVDLSQLERSIRPVIRSQLSGSARRGDLRRWARRAGLFAVVDSEGFFSLSPDPAKARRALRIDARPGRHTIALGRALGYPICCCRAAARHKEAELDDWAEAMSSRRFIGMFRLIEPGGYVAGKAAISHVPCSPRCSASLQMARALIARKGTGWAFAQKAMQMGRASSARARGS